MDTDTYLNNGHLELVKLLLERDAEVHALNDEGRTPYQLTMGKGYRKIADLLWDHERGEYDDIILAII